MSDSFYIDKVAVLGAGVMGAQIAAHFANAHVPTLLFDLKQEGDPNALVNAALKNLAKLKPAPTMSSDSFLYITAANYDDDLSKLSDCNVIIEAVAERIDIKESLYSKIADFISANCILASNTSGLSIELLAKSIPAKHIKNFCGVHFFNPPRYMKLVELIPAKQTNHSVLHSLEDFLVNNMGKKVVYTKDTPNFIANRVGVFSMMVACKHTEELGIPFEVVDKITGSKLGRAKSATFRTADVVGLDVLSHVLNTMTLNCSEDGFASFYVLPNWLDALIKQGSLGQKTKGGIYKKIDGKIYVLDLATNEYRLSDKKPSDEVMSILSKQDWSDKMSLLRHSDLVEAKFLWNCFRDIFHYVAVLLGNISDNVKDIDLALRHGFGWKEGVFEIWQKAGWKQVVQWIQEDIDANKSLSTVSLPNWIYDVDQVYGENSYYDISHNKLVEWSYSDIYHDNIQISDLLLNQSSSVKKYVLYEDEGVVLWHTGDDIGILSFKSKMCSIGMSVINGISNAIDYVEDNCRAMVIWQEDDIFSVGANLEEFGFSIMMNGIDAVDDIVKLGQHTIVGKLRRCKVPVVSAVKGYTFGGGCEIMLHSSAVVAHVESYIGLIEVGVGLLPGWGGTTEMAFRAMNSFDHWKKLENNYKNIAMAQVATSAYEAKDLGYLRESDTIVMNNLLYVAKEKANLLSVSGYRPPISRTIDVFGEQGIATINAFLINLLNGNQISDHDFLILKNVAYVICGGDVAVHSKVSESWLLDLELAKFKELVATEKTTQRIEYMLKNGKPLRN